MITLARFSAETILPLIGLDKPSIRLLGMWVRANSTRLECFRRNQTCCSCGVRGTLFLLQQHVTGVTHRTNCFIDNCDLCYLYPHKQIQGDVPHLNFYHLGKRGGLTLMTQDHIMPRSRGGSNKMDNLQTMCCNCNNRKGNTIPRHLRKDTNHVDFCDDSLGSHTILRI